MKSAKDLWIDYFGHSKNWLDLMQIAFTLTTALSSLSYEDICKFSWMQNLIYLMVLASFFQLYNDIAHCLPNNEFMHVQQYLNMFYHVSARYLIILAGFLPLLMAFAWCFHGKAKDFFQVKMKNVSLLKIEYVPLILLFRHCGRKPAIWRKCGRIRVQGVCHV